MKYEIIKGLDGKAQRVDFKEYKPLPKTSGRIFQYLIERKNKECRVDSICQFVYGDKYNITKITGFNAQICLNIKPMCERLGYSLVRTKHKIKLLTNGKE